MVRKSSIGLVNSGSPRTKIKEATTGLHHRIFEILLEIGCLNIYSNIRRRKARQTSMSSETSSGRERFLGVRSP